MTEKAKELLAGLSPSTEFLESELPGAVARWTAEALANGIEDTAIGAFAGAHGVINAKLTANAGSWGSLLLLVPDIREWPVPGMKDQLGLTAREAEVLAWVAYGKTNREIGQILSISPRTVNKHLDHIFMKLGVETRAAAAAVAICRNRELNGGFREAAPFA
jgi:DNA-binding CsgD family transcriptional regulator